jgi:hypothetical protein
MCPMHDEGHQCNCLGVYCTAAKNRLTTEQIISGFSPTRVPGYLAEATASTKALKAYQ